MSFDLLRDWRYVEASFRACYGLRLAAFLRHATWREFMVLLNGLPSASPLVEYLVWRKREGPPIETPADALAAFEAAWGF